MGWWIPLRGGKGAAVASAVSAVTGARIDAVIAVIRTDLGRPVTAVTAVSRPAPRRRPARRDRRDQGT